MQEKHEGAASGPLDLRVWVRLLSCVMQMEKRLRRNFVEEFDTTLPRFDVMASLDRYPDGQTMGDLSRSLLVSKRSEEHTSELQSLMRISYAVFCLKKKTIQHNIQH